MIMIENTAIGSGCRFFASVMVIGAALLAAGCGSSQSTIETAALATSPIPAGKARVTITRPSGMLYAGAPATITLNGAKVAIEGGRGVMSAEEMEPPMNKAAATWLAGGTANLRPKEWRRENDRVAELGAVRRCRGGGR